MKEPLFLDKWLSRVGGGRSEDTGKFESVLRVIKIVPSLFWEGDYKNTDYVYRFIELRMPPTDVYYIDRVKVDFISI